MKRLAEGLYQLGGFPPNAINIYVLGDVLVDSGSRLARGRVTRQLKKTGLNVSAHALTHAHSDHQGSSHALCEALGIPFWCPDGDVEAAEDPRVMLARMPDHPINRFLAGRFAGPGHPVSRRLKAGDVVGGFTVVDTPGHTAGHVSYWREADCVLVLGDVVAHMNMLTGLPALRQPPWFFSADPARNRTSARTVAALDPTLICFGHGPPLRDTAKFRRFVDGLAID